MNWSIELGNNLVWNQESEPSPTLKELLGLLHSFELAADLFYFALDQARALLVDFYGQLVVESVVVYNDLDEGHSWNM